MYVLPHFIHGVRVEGAAPAVAPIYDPNTGDVQGRVALATPAEVEAAVASARRAQPGWAALNPQRRARVMFEFKRLIERETPALAALLSSEHGKTIADARGDIQRGLEVVEFACGVPHLLKGEHTQGAGTDIDVFSLRQPIGVAVGITPFNFPAMIPLWMCAPAIACGNSFIIKPSERDPSVPVRLAELFIAAGAEIGLDVAGVLNVVQGDRTAVELLVDHPAVRAVSFVGSSDIAQSVYARAAQHGKRVQAMGGAKNHGVVLPDADMDQVVADVLGAAYGSAGERCMALPVIVPVGRATAEALRARLVEGVRGLRVGVSSDPQAHYGPVVSAAHKARIETYIQMGVDEGAELVVDGRGLTLQGHAAGFFVGPSLFDHVAPTMRSYQEEIFGPVLQMVRVETLDEALALASDHPYGNGVAIFTRDGPSARRFADRVEVGMVGINVPIPVPVAYHSFGGWKRSGFGDLNQYGMDGVRFYTRTKTVTQRWPSGAAPVDQSFVIPTLG